MWYPWCRLVQAHCMAWQSDQSCFEVPSVTVSFDQVVGHVQVLSCLLSLECKGCIVGAAGMLQQLAAATRACAVVQ